VVRRVRTARRRLRARLEAPPRRWRRAHRLLPRVRHARGRTAVWLV